MWSTRERRVGLGLILENLGSWFMMCNSWSSEFEDAKENLPSKESDGFFWHGFNAHEEVTNPQNCMFSKRTCYYLDLYATPTQILDTNVRRTVEFMAYDEIPKWRIQFGKRKYFIDRLATRSPRA